MTPLISKSLRLLGTLVLGIALHTLAAPFAATNAEAACVSGVASNDVLNIRNGAGGSYNIVGFIRPGECGVVTERRQGNWVWVDYGRGGYVHSRYLRDEGGDGNESGHGGGQRGDGGDAAFRCVVGVASNDVLNVRSGPSASNRIVGQLTNHTCFVEVIAKRGRWFKITKDGTTGWVNSRYLN